MESNIWESVAAGGPFAILFAWLLWWVVSRWWPEQRADHKEQMAGLLASCERQYKEAIGSNAQQWGQVNTTLKDLTSAIQENSELAKRAYSIPQEVSSGNRH